MPSARKTSTGPQAQTVPTPDDQASPYAATTWGSTLGEAVDLQVPSGQLCLVKRPGVQGLLTAGVLHNIDSLSQLVNKKHLKRGKKGKADEINVGSLLQDPKSLEQITHTVDRVVCHVVVKPDVVMAPNDVTARKPGVIYSDMVDLIDKMYIFQFVVGGVHSLESFRGELDAAVGGVEAGAGVEPEAE